MNFTDSYVEFRRGEAWLIGLHIAPYTNTRVRGAKRGQAPQTADARTGNRVVCCESGTEGLTVVPSKLYLKHGKIKVSWLLDGAAAARSPRGTEAPC